MARCEGPARGTHPPGLIQRYREELEVRHYAHRTVTTYEQWLRRFLRFHRLRHPREMGSKEVNAFLTHLAVELQVSASTQNQALSALLFLYRELLGRDLDLEGVIRARTRPRLPVVMTVAEVRAVLEQLDGVEGLVAGVMYGGGLRLMEALRLRVHDLDFSAGRSRFAMAKEARIGARCCHHESVGHFRATWRRCEPSIGRTLPKAMEECTFPTPWGESIPMHRSSGVGNGFFRNTIDGVTQEPGNRADIIWIPA